MPATAVRPGRGPGRPFRFRGRPGHTIPPTQPGVTFLPQQLVNARVVIEFAWGANIGLDSSTWRWTDETARVRFANGISITQGRSDELSNASTASCQFELDNSGGGYMPYNPASPNWPNVVRNVPVRVSIDSGTSGPDIRFQGYVASYTPWWDPTGQGLAVVSIAANGILRRLEQGKTPLRSALYRAILASNPVAYWSLEDATGATQAGSALSGGTAMTGTATKVSFGTAAGTGGSDSVADFTNGGTLTAQLPSTATSTSWRIFCIAKLTLTGTDLSPVVGWTTLGTRTKWELQADLNGVYLQWTDANGNFGSTTLFTSFSAANLSDGAIHRIRIDAVPGGPYVQVHIDEVLNDIPVDMTGETFGAITSVTADPVSVSGAANKHPAALGHIAVWSQFTSTASIDSAATGYVGEAASDRMSRLCTEQSVPIVITGSSTTLMGAQSVDTFTNLLRECEAADGGVLYDGFSAGLGYICRSAKYNQSAALTLDMAGDPPQVDAPFAPLDDDQRNRNDWTITRKGGSTSRYVDSTSPLGTAAIGVYDSSATINVSTDDVLVHHAEWRVHLGTVVGLRYPNLAVNLVAVPSAVNAWLAANLGNRIDVLNPSSKALQHPTGTVSLLLEGYTETFDPFRWTIAANGSPYAPWRVAILQSASAEFLWLLDSAGTILHQDYPAGSTSLTADVSDGGTWSTTAADYPLSLDVGGVKVTATACSAVSSTQFTFTVGATSVLLRAGSAVKLWQPPVLGL